MRVVLVTLLFWDLLLCDEVVNGFGIGRVPLSNPLPCRSSVSGSPSFLLAQNDGEDSSEKKTEEEEIKPDILLPFPPAADPMYKCRGEIGKGQFVVTREGEPRAEELTDENMLRIVKSQSTDLEVNTLVWKCLGYRFDAESECWNPDKVFPNWKSRFESPPDLIGMQRIYEKEIDQPSLKSNQALVKSVPIESKQSLKKFLKPLGWSGYKVRRHITSSLFSLLHS